MIVGWVSRAALGVAQPWPDLPFGFPWGCDGAGSSLSIFSAAPDLVGGRGGRKGPVVSNGMLVALPCPRTLRAMGPAHARLASSPACAPTTLTPPPTYLGQKGSPSRLKAIAGSRPTFDYDIMVCARTGVVWCALELLSAE